MRGFGEGRIRSNFRSSRWINIWRAGRAPLSILSQIWSTVAADIARGCAQMSLGFVSRNSALKPDRSVTSRRGNAVGGTLSSKIRFGPPRGCPTSPRSRQMFRQRSGRLTIRGSTEPCRQEMIRSIGRVGTSGVRRRLSGALLCYRHALSLAAASRACRPPAPDRKRRKRLPRAWSKSMPGVAAMPTSRQHTSTEIGAVVRPVKCNAEQTNRTTPSAVRSLVNPASGNARNR